MDSTTKKSPYEGMSLDELLDLLTFDGPDNLELWEAIDKLKLQEEIRKKPK